MSYASGIIDGNPTKSRWLRTRLFTALIGACGFGLELGRAAGYYKHPRLGDSLILIFMMGFIFLAIAILNSIRIISQVQDIQNIAKKWQRPMFSSVQVSLSNPLVRFPRLPGLSLAWRAIRRTA
jgi:uncharacterized membrane protein (Fun14 family)